MDSSNGKPTKLRGITELIDAWNNGSIRTHHHYVVTKIRNKEKQKSCSNSFFGTNSNCDLKNTDEITPITDENFEIIWENHARILNFKP